MEVIATKCILFHDSDASFEQLLQHVNARKGPPEDSSSYIAEVDEDLHDLDAEIEEAFTEAEESMLHPWDAEVFRLRSGS